MGVVEEARSRGVAVYGLGRIGLGVVAVLLKNGFHKVVGVDVDGELVGKLNSGVIDHPDPRVVKIVSKGVEEKWFYATTDGVAASRNTIVKLVDVPLTTGRDLKPDYSHIDAALRSIGLGLKEGDLVVVETTLPPRGLEDHVKPLLEEVSGLKAGREFYLAYAPERVMAERIVYDIEEAYPRLVAGVDEESSRVVREFYEVFSRRGVITASSPRVLELARLFEGVYRDVNIALANEYARLAQVLGVDYEEVTRLASTNPYIHPHKPGPGTGGMCLPFYPYFTIHVADEYGLSMDLVYTARRVNEEQPEWVVGLIHEATRRIGLEPKQASIAVLGLSYRGNIGDTRNSPSLTVIEMLLRDGYREIRVYDPLVKKPVSLPSVNVVHDLVGALRGVDVVVVMTDHEEFKGLKLSFIKRMVGRKRIAVVDARDMLVLDDVQGVVYAGVGRPWTTS